MGFVVDFSITLSDSRAVICPFPCILTPFTSGPPLWRGIRGLALGLAGIVPILLLIKCSLTPIPQTAISTNFFLSYRKLITSSFLKSNMPVPEPESVQHAEHAGAKEVEEWCQTNIHNLVRIKTFNEEVEKVSCYMCKGDAICSSPYAYHPIMCRQSMTTWHSNWRAGTITRNSLRTPLRQMCRCMGFLCKRSTASCSGLPPHTLILFLAVKRLFARSAVECIADACYLERYLLQRGGHEQALWYSGSQCK